MPNTTCIPLCPIDVTQYLDVQAQDDIRVKGRRIGIEHIVYFYLQGWSPEQIVQMWPDLDLKAVYTIIAYYLHHKSEIDAYIAYLDSEAQAARHEWEQHRSPASLRMESILKERLSRQNTL